MRASGAKVQLKIEIQDKINKTTLKKQAKDFMKRLTSGANLRDVFPSVGKTVTSMRKEGYWGFLAEDNDAAWLIGHTPGGADDSPPDLTIINIDNKGGMNIGEYIEGFMGVVGPYMDSLVYDSTPVSMEVDFYIENLDELGIINSLVNKEKLSESIGQIQSLDYRASYKDSVDLSAHFGIVHKTGNNERKALSFSLSLGSRQPAGHDVLSELLRDKGRGVTNIMQSILDRACGSD